MRSLILLATLVLLAVTIDSTWATVTASNDTYILPTENEIMAKWVTFKAEHDLHSDEKYARFRSEFLKVDLHNYEFEHGNHTYSTQVTMISLIDFTGPDGQLQFGLRQDRARTRGNFQLHTMRTNKTIPDSADWRSTFVNGPKFQSTCGACWAFATAGVMESLTYRTTGVREEFSVQQLIDCTKPTRSSIPATMRNFGCLGGYPDNGFEYVKAFGLTDARNYQYIAREGSCYESYFTNRTKLRGYADVPYGREDMLKKAVALYGPTAVGIDASKWGFANYQGGIYSDSSCSQSDLNHAVIVVGYGTDNGKDYWLIRNSWGSRWGLGGYIKMARNQANTCGIASLASYVY